MDLKQFARQICRCLLPAALLAVSACGKTAPTSPQSAAAVAASIPAGYVTAEELGVYGSDNEDDYPAVSAALEEGKNIFFGTGVYQFSKTLHLNGRNIAGCGMMATTLQYTGQDKSPLLRAGGKCSVTDLQLSVKTGLLSGTEKTGEYVLLWLGDQKGLAAGSIICNVRFADCGTGVYAPGDMDAACTGAQFDTLEMTGFTYRGFDLQSPNRSSNTYNNIYISNMDPLTGSPKPPVSDAMFALEGTENQPVVRQLNVEHATSANPVILNGCTNLDASTIHVEGVTIGKADGAYVSVSRTTGHMGALTVYYTPIDYARGSVLRFGAAVSEDAFQVDTLQLKGLNDPNAQLHGGRSGGLLSGEAASFRMVSCEAGASPAYHVKIESYVYDSMQKDKSVYESFPCDSGVVFLAKGVLPAGGSTASRPTSRRCPSYTTYFDTDLKKLFVWDGARWTNAT